MTALQTEYSLFTREPEDELLADGTKRRRYLEENLGALDVELTPDELASIEAVAPRGVAVGDRYDPANMARLNG